MEGSGSLNENVNTLCLRTELHHSATRISPAKLVMNRILNSKLHIIKPRGELHKSVFLPNVTKHFKKVDEVCIRIFSISNKWIPGIILCRTGPVSYKALTEKRNCKET